MNVLFVCEYDWFKSIVFDIHMLAEGLSLRGHRVYAVDYEWDEKSGIRFQTVEVNASRIYPEAKVMLRRPGFVRIHFGSLKLLPLEYFSALIMQYLEIRKVIREKQIDVVVLYSVLTNGVTTVHLARSLGVPVVHRNIDMLHNLSSSLVKRQATKFFEKKVYPAVDLLLALTPNYAEYLERFGANSSRIKLLLFPIDTSLFHQGIDYSQIRQKWGVTNKDKVLVWMGTLYRFSGLPELLREFPALVKRVPNAKLVIVGDGPIRLSLELSVKELGLEGRVTITGYQPFQTMPQFINMADLCINAFVVNEITKDLFSAKVIQYLACGKPVVCSSLPGMMTLLPGESCGIVYAENTADMVVKIADLLLSDERRSRLGQAGLGYVRREHSCKQIIGQFEAALLEAISLKLSRSLKPSKGGGGVS